jgi:hypothetical protein
MTPPRTPSAPDPLADVLVGALRAVTPPADTGAVSDAIATRRRQRQVRARRRRGAAAVAATATGVAACLLVVALLARPGVDRVDSVEPAATATTEVADPGPVPEIDTGERSPLGDGVVLKGQLGPTVLVPGDGERIEALTAGSDGWWIARGDPVDATDPVVSTLTHVRADGALGTRTEIHGVPRFAVEDGDRLWVVSEDRVRNSTDGTRYRLKEIDRSSGEVRASVAIGESADVLGVRLDGDEVRIVHVDATSVLDPATGTVRVLPGEPGSDPTVTRVLTSDEVRWVERDGPQEVAAFWLDDPSSTRPVQVPGLQPLVAADAWAAGAAAAAVDTAVGVDLVELTPPPRAAPDGAPSTRTRLNGLPAGTRLLAVGDDRVWLLVEGSLVATALD